jgi:hypothetical protein
MPFIVAHSVVSFLRRCAYTKKQRDRAAEQRETRRLAGGAIDQVRARHQQYNRPHVGPDRAAIAARQR